jgi:hypothetical protein
MIVGTKPGKWYYSTIESTGKEKNKLPVQEEEEARKTTQPI